jgi:PTH1 family peptidyl-tRNA hydrolase
MFLIVGLGNPGEKYENTPHNIGFIAVDNFAKDKNFPDFKINKKFNAEISEKTINGKKVILAKPQAFMNNSGISIKKAISFLKINFEDLIIIHDDIDIPFGQIKIAKNRGSAGHKGVMSAIKELGTMDFIRIRIGIQTDKAAHPHSHINVKKFVLKKFSGKEKIAAKEATYKAREVMEIILEEGVEKAMTRFNK